MTDRLDSIPVFYSTEMVAEFESFSPSAAKPKYVMESWLALEIPISVSVPEPVTRGDLVRAHSSKFVDAVLEGRADNGFGSRSSVVTQSVLWTSGAMLGAARTAITNGRVAVAPCSGFHHACYDHAGTYCTFNGLMVVALSLVAQKLAKSVGILDFDQHYGDGTDDILNRLYQPPIVHYTAGRYYSHHRQADDFLGAIPGIMEAFSGVGVVLYQAGADPHVADPLGGWLTTPQLAERDRLVFATARSMNIPIAWNLAGGYQRPVRKVLDIHDNTLRACSDVFLER